MKKYELLSEIWRRRKWKQMEQQVHKYENLLNRQFQANKPNHKWVTDISYIRTGQGVLYLSIIRDLSDNSIIVHKTGTSQSDEYKKEKQEAEIEAKKVTKARKLWPRLTIIVLVAFLLYLLFFDVLSP